jgi:hypothetical protein
MMQTASISSLPLAMGTRALGVMATSSARGHSISVRGEARGHGQA